MPSEEYILQSVEPPLKKDKKVKASKDNENRMLRNQPTPKTGKEEKTRKNKDRQKTNSKIISIITINVKG